MGNQTTVAVDRARQQPPPATARGATIRRYALIFATLLVASTGYTAVMVAKLPDMSPIDGLVYMDAFDRAMSGQATVRGDVLQDRTIDFLACRGSYVFGSAGLTCGPNGRALRDDDRARFNDSVNSAYVHPPTYFLATAAAVHAVQAVWPGDADDFDLARGMGALWFSLGALLLIRAAALWGASPWAAMLVMLALLPTPTFMSMFTVISPDAMGLVVAGGIVLGVTMWWQRRMAAWPLLFFGILACAVKLTYVVSVFAGVIVLAFLWYGRRSRGVGETVRAAAWLLAGSMLGVLAWEVIREIIAKAETVPVGSSGPYVLQPSIESLISLLVVPGAGIPAQAAGSVPSVTIASGLLLGMLTAGAAGGALVYTRRTGLRFALAAGGVTSLVLAGFVVSVLTLISDGVLLPAASRYAFGAWPFYVLPLLLLARRRWVAAVCVIIALVSMVSWLTWPVQDAPTVTAPVAGSGSP